MSNGSDWKEHYKSEILNALSSFNAVTAAKGADYYRQGRVKLISLKKDNDGIHCEADVEGGRRYEVDLTLSESGELDAYCTCPVVDSYCKHVYAALRKCYASLDKDDSGSQKGDLLDPHKSNPHYTTLLEVVEKASGKAATPSQQKRLARIVDFFEKTQKGKELSIGDASQMGLKVDGYPWEELDAWNPEDPPKSISEFWLLLVAYAKYSKGGLDKDLDLNYDFSLIDDYLQKVKQKILEEQYREFYKKLTYNIPSKNLLNLKSSADLYLKVSQTRAELEGVFSMSPEYKTLKFEDLKYLWEGMSHNSISMDLGSKFIAENLNALDMYGSVFLDLELPRDIQILRVILLNDHAKKKIITEDGSAYEWATEPLEWVVQRVEDNSNEEESYAVALEWEDDIPIPEWDAYLPGNPTFYISRNLIALGPNPDNELFDINSKTVLPTEWVTREKTIKAFQEVGFKLPEDLAIPPATKAEPIRPVLQFKVWLQEDEAHEEVCRITVSAVMPEDKSPVLHYASTGWVIDPDFDAGLVGLESIEQLNDFTECVDDTSIRHMPSLMRFLSPYYNEEKICFELVLTRHFPELFHFWLQGIPNDSIVELDPVLTELEQGEIDGNISLDIKEIPSNTDWFDVDLVLDTGDVELTKEEKELLLKAAGKWVRLKNGSWKKLNFSFSEDDDRDLAALGFSPKELSAGPQRAHAIQLSNKSAEKWIGEEKFQSIKKRVSEIELDVKPEIPSEITATLRPYQTEGFHFLSYLSTNSFGGILADDMGLGKTLQTLTWLKELQNNQEVPDGPVLVVCPKSVMDNWSHEVDHFSNDTRIHVWDAGRIRNLKISENQFEIHVLNYAQMRNKSSQLQNIEWMAIILDEAQNIKNPTSQAWRTATSLNARYRLALTGTPIENRLMDLWSIMEFTMPGVLGNRSGFQKQFNPKKDPLAQYRLTNRIRPFILRRTKDQVAADLPEKVEEDILCDLNGEQLSMYKAELKHAQQVMLKIQTSKELNKVKFNVLTSLLRLRQICCHPKLYSEESAASSAKLEAFEEHVGSILDQGSKVLVFSQFVEMLGILSLTARKNGWKTWELTGKTENRGQLVKDFQEHDGPGVFLISLKAGGAGLNLTSAQYVILFDPWWNPAVENQAIDRTHRIGQTSRVVAYRFLAKDTVEQKIRHLQQEKSRLAAEVLDESKFSESLTLDDLQYILSDSDKDQN